TRRAPGRARSPARRAAREAAHRQGQGVRAVTLSEARLSFLSHAILRALVDESLGQVRNDRLFLAEAKRALSDGFSLDGRLDPLARARMPRRGLPRRPAGAGLSRRSS